jgi:glycosyltransferase involved in cell wall biosynthesis
MSKVTCFSKKHPIEIGILEIRRHIPILYSFSKISKTKNTNVTIFTTKELLLQLEAYLKDTENYNIVLKKDDESTFSFLKRVEKICNEKIDLLFVNTIHDIVFDLIYYVNFRPKSKMIVIVHHANAWLKPRLILKINHLLRTIDTNMSSILISKFILPRFNAINVIYAPIKNYIEKNTNYQKEIFTLPTSIFEENERMITNQREGKIRLVIPGIIQEHRRDYKMMITIFENLFERFNDRLILSVPGLPVGQYGKSIYETFMSMKNSGFDVLIFDHYVPDETLDEILKNSDVILAPIRINSRADNEIEEQYGITVGSGIVFDAIKYAKPIVVPSEFNMLEELRSSTLKYSDSKELEQIIEEMISNPEKLEHLKKEALANSRKFSLEKLQKYFEENILKLVKTGF